MDACWLAAEEHGMDGLTAETIALYLPAATHKIRRLFPQTASILLAMMDQLARDTAAIPLNPQAPKQEALFELIMARFDALQKRRKAVTKLYQDLICKPRHFFLLPKLRPKYISQIEEMLQSVSISIDHFIGWGKVNLMAIFCLRLFNIWVADETDDLNKTMAALDQGLAFLERTFHRSRTF